MQPKQVGETCSCEVCATGLYCELSAENKTLGMCAIQKTCGNKECDPGECLTCPKDCSLGTCTGNDECDTAVGENCLNTPDCKCKSGKCNPLSEGAGADGCLVSACGDGVCLPTECSSCSLDCKPKNCLNGECDIGIGENCENSKDCICDIELDFGSKEIIVKPNTKNMVSFNIKNTGNSRQQYTLTIGNGEVYTSWKKATVDLSPGQELPQQIEIWSNEVGSHELQLNITSGKISFDKKILIDVPAPDVAETTSGALEAVFKFKEFWELPAFIISVYAVLRYLYWRFKSPQLVVRHDEQSPNSRFHTRFQYPHPNYQQYYQQYSQPTYRRAQAWYPNLSQNQ